MPVLVDATTRTVLVDTDTRKVLFQPTLCSPPDGACIHYIAFDVKFTADDVDNDFSELLDFTSDDAVLSNDMFVSVDSGQWEFATTFITDGFDLRIYTTDVPFVADSYYSVLIAFSDPGIDSDTVEVTFCVNGVSVSTTISKINTVVNYTFSHLFIGDMFGGDNVVNRKYRRVVAYPGFNIATDSFDTLVNASIIVEDGENVLLIDSGSDVGYGEKDGLTWKISCGLGYGACCEPFGTTCSIRTHDSCIDDIGGTYLGNGTTCAGTPCGTPPPEDGACCYGSGLDIFCVITDYFTCGVDPYFGYFVGPGSDCPCSSACCSCSAGCSDVSGDSGSCFGAWLGWGSNCATDAVLCQSYRHGVCCYADPCQCISGQAPDACGGGFYAGDCSACGACGCEEF